MCSAGHIDVYKKEGSYYILRGIVNTNLFVGICKGKLKNNCYLYGIKNYTIFFISSSSA